MDRGDIEKAMDMFYEEMRWDIATGSPTAAAYRELTLAYIADELTKLSLLP
jgi:aldehyde:ferredoxin oxidoreductase